MATSAPSRDRGQALLVMMIVLVMGSLYALSARLDATAMKSRHAQATGAALHTAREALLAYAATYRDAPDHSAQVWGYLPCPDTAAKAGFVQPGDGTAAPACGSAGQAAVGLLPYRTLGLPELRDGDGNCLWYAVSGSFKNSPKAATPLNWDTQGQFSVAAAGALHVAPDDANGGAAAIVFAPGPALAGRSRRTLGQPCGADPAEAFAYLESTPDSFVGGIVRQADGSIANNDQLAWITPRDVFTRIVARADFKNRLDGTPEGRLNRLMDASRQALDTRLWDDMVTHGAATSGLPAAGYAGDYRQFAGKAIGDVPDLTPLPYAGYDGDFDHWRDQFRYAVCSDLKADGCLIFGAKRCRGTLWFGGQARADAFPFGGPRPSGQKPGTTQPSRSDSLIHYFESGAGLDLLDGPSLAIVAASSYGDDARSADVAACLAPGTYATAAKDIAAFKRVATSASQPEAAIDVAAGTVQMGNPAATAAGRGCAWLPTPLPFDSVLRVYFRLRLADRGEGLVFVVADAAANRDAMDSDAPCGGGAGAQLGYAGGNIAPPKFGLEIDTRTQSGTGCSGSNRNDPDAAHMAFVFWGNAASDTDDNCHGAGVAGSGSEPLNPRSLVRNALGIPVGIKTVQKSDPHLPFDGSLPLDTDIHVRLDVRKNFDAIPLRALTWSAATGTATAATFAPHGLRPHQRITLTGAVPAGYDGTYAIAVPDADHFAFAPAVPPGTYVSGGHVTAPLGVAVQAASWAAGTATIVTAPAHGFVSGQTVSIGGVSPAGYNGTHAIVVFDAERFSYELDADPGLYVSGGALTPAATLTLRAYVASRLEVSGTAYRSTCTVAHLRNLAADIGSQCAQRPSIALDEVPMDATTGGRTLAAVYAGFANAQNSGDAGRQRLTVADFAILSQ